MRSAVRLTAGDRSASGVLTSPALIDASLRAHLTGTAAAHLIDQATHVITAAHFAANTATAAVASPLVNTLATDFTILTGTDIAIGRLHTPAPVCGLMPIAPHVRPGQRVISMGFSGQSGLPAQHLVPRLVTSAVISNVPWILTYNFRTRARHGAILMPLGLQWARRGDSGGPITANGQLVGIQSMVAMPFGVPIGIAAVNLLGPHLPALKAAMSQ